MNRFRQTLEQALGEVVPGPDSWPEDTVPKILELLWKAYDRLFATKLTLIDISQADLQLERSVNALLSDEIQAIMLEEGGFSSYVVSHERWEMETLLPGSNRPPQYDIAFVWRGHEILKWPCEAKVLRTERDVSAYVADIRTAFIPCVYGPFSESGSMLGFLVLGNAHVALAAIQASLSLPLSTVEPFNNRPHKICSLSRIPPEGKNYPRSFRLHHLIMHLSSSSQG